MRMLVVLLGIGKRVKMLQASSRLMGRWVYPAGTSIVCLQQPVFSHRLMCALGFWLTQAASLLSCMLCAVSDTYIVC